VLDLGLDGDTPEKVRVRSDGRTLLRLDHGHQPSPPGQLTPAARRALTGAAGVLVADYGRGLAAQPAVRRALGRLPAQVPVVWDPHPRGPAPVPGARLATPNLAEAAAFARRVPAAATQLATAAAHGQALAARWRAAGVAVTLGSRGVLLVEGEGSPRLLAAPPVAAGDPCGAGDRFASTAAGRLAAGALTSEAVAAAVDAAARFVAGGGAAGVELAAGQPDPTRTVGLEQAEELVAAVRRRRGTVVATGGCFDLLHAGHVATLSSARALGDCLIVCLNSDHSVRRLKGPARPLVPERDRAAVLAALGCVDAVVVFDEPTPEHVLDRLRPDVFAKGGDYALTDLPEAALLAAWGGQAVILPYVAGRSTTRLLEEARRHAPDSPTGAHAGSGPPRHP
jgi:D-beta-D-heptose 7-phosphate kinase/D-beta-D-heptose 1-phosphate adenosyltransferase